jgi:ribonuclease VapC
MAFVRIIDSSRCLSLATCVFEAVLAVSKQKRVEPTRAHTAVSKLLEAAFIEVVPLTPDMISHAVAARERYGHGRKGLNMGDCLSYAAARTLGLKLLYKGDDFAATDVNT